MKTLRPQSSLSFFFFPSLVSCYTSNFNHIQGQPASGDGVSLCPCGSADINQGVPEVQRTWWCDLLVDPLAALQAHVCIWSGETHITLSNMVGSYRYASLCLYTAGRTVTEEIKSLYKEKIKMLPRPADVNAQTILYISLCQWTVTILFKSFLHCWIALTYHYETQCIPTPLAWFAHQLPVWWQKLSVMGTFVIEIVVPLFFFSPLRRLRLGAFYLQVVIHLHACFQSLFSFCALQP